VADALVETLNAWLFGEGLWGEHGGVVSAAASVGCNGWRASEAKTGG